MLKSNGVLVFLFSYLSGLIGSLDRQWATQEFGDITGGIGSQNQPVQTINQSCMVLFLLRIESIVDGKFGYKDESNVTEIDCFFTN